MKTNTKPTITIENRHYVIQAPGVKAKFPLQAKKTISFREFSRLSEPERLERYKEASDTRTYRYLHDPEHVTCKNLGFDPENLTYDQKNLLVIEHGFSQYQFGYVSGRYTPSETQYFKILPVDDTWKLLSRTLPAALKKARPTAHV